MARQTRSTLLCLLLLAVCGPALAQTAGKITEVRVYQGQALVTRQVQFEAVAGSQEVTVTDLPERVVPGSLYATGGDTLSVRAVRFRSTAVSEEPRPEVRELDAKIKEQMAAQRRSESESQVLASRVEFLDRLGQFTAAKFEAEVAQGALNPEAVEKTATFIFQQRDQIAAKAFELQEQALAIEESLALLQRQRAELTRGGANVQRDAVIFVDAAQAGPAVMHLSYLVEGVGWTPAYSARLSKERDKVALEYHAALTQMSGEDWNSVALTLSTSHPKMLASAPILSPLRIALVGRADRQAEDADAITSYTEKTRELQRQIRGPVGSKGAAGPAGPRGERGPVGAGMPGMTGAAGGMEQPAPPAQVAMPSADDEYLNANLFAAQLQNVELTAPDEVVRLSRVIGGATEGLAVDYPIEGAVSIQSRRDQQMFLIARLDLKADFSYTAVPLLTDYVYRAAECVNSSDLALLAGPYNAYVDGAFSGRGEIPLVASGQSFTLGFGTETRLRASREFLEKTTSTRGGNQIVQYKYRLALQNYMAEPAAVRLWDRLPQAPDNQVTVQLVDPQPPLTTDPLYLAQQRPRGLLRWDVQVPAGASGAKAYSFEYQFQIEHDRSYDIGDLPSSVAETMRRDLEVMKSIEAGQMMMQ